MPDVFHFTTKNHAFRTKLLLFEWLTAVTCWVNNNKHVHNDCESGNIVMCRRGTKRRNCASKLPYLVYHMTEMRVLSWNSLQKLPEQKVQIEKKRCVTYSNFSCKTSLVWICCTKQMWTGQQRKFICSKWSRNQPAVLGMNRDIFHTKTSFDNFPLKMLIRWQSGFVQQIMYRYSTRDASRYHPPFEGLLTTFETKSILNRSTPAVFPSWRIPISKTPSLWAKENLKRRN